MSEAYDRFLALVKARHTCRGFKKDPVPEGAIEQILEAALGDVRRQFAALRDSSS